MKTTTCLFTVILFFLFVAEINAQNYNQKLYRVHVEDFTRIRNLESTGVTIYNMAPGKYIEIIATTEQMVNLESRGFKIEFLANDFKELQNYDRLKASPEYHDYQETMDELADIAARFPGITKLDILGQSVLGRDLACLKISDNPDMDEDETPILICGNHHGNEVLGVEAVLYQINYLVDNYGIDDEVTYWIDNYEIWFVPMVNPDGREAVRRYNENGVDLNRNYSFQHTAVGNHGQPFSEPETQVIRDLSALYPPVMSLTYHTSGRYVLLAWTHTDEAAPDSSALIYLGNKVAESIEFPEGASTGYYELLQGGRWYFTAGEYCDYMYSTHNTLAFTLEMWTSQNPEGSVIPQVVERNLEGFKTLLRQASKSGVTGLISDKITGLPVQAEISLPIIDEQGKLSPRLADETFGRYYRYLVPGLHRLNFSADGYRDKLVDVIITEDAMTVVDIQMESGPLLELAENKLLDDNGKVNIGETLAYVISLNNVNTIDAVNTYAKVRTSSNYVHLINDSIYFGLIPGQDVVTAKDTIRFTVDPACPDGELIDFKLEVHDSVGIGWILGFSSEVYAPDLFIESIKIIDKDGNDNSVFDGGEKVLVDIGLKNSGRQSVHNLEGLISTGDPNFTLHTDFVTIEEIPEGETLSLIYEIQLSNDVPDLFLGNLNLNIVTEEGYSSDLKFQLNNINGFFDNFDMGGNGWTHASYMTSSNTHDDWQIGDPAGKAGDPESPFSGENCWGTDMGWDWFQNDSWDGAYQRNVYNYLKSPVINCTNMTGVGLRYMRWLTTLLNGDATIKVNDSIVWKSARRGHSDMDWFEHKIDISGIADGNPEVRITFELETGNGAIAGGWNIDDVIVAGGLYSGTSTNEIDLGNNINLSCFPNPFNDHINISFELKEPAEVEIQLYDAFGRKVRVMERQHLPQGNHNIEWKGKDQRGNDLSNGMYYIKVNVDGQSKAETIIIKTRNQ